MIRACQLPRGSRVVDIGAGASVLAEALLDEGLRPTLNDLADAALARVRERLGPRSGEVDFRVGDITTLALPEAAFDLWHDRAVFHFLTAPEDREAYLVNLRRALKPGGFDVLASFALEGPEKCSGLPVCRYDAAGLAAALDPGFELLETAREGHPTPFGTSQEFQYACFRRR
jgi:ubiquinone/menaquinone biosynthesis C-methylase UbiE